MFEKKELNEEELAGVNGGAKGEYAQYDENFFVGKYIDYEFQIRVSPGRYMPFPGQHVLVTKTGGNPSYYISGSRVTCANGVVVPLSGIISWSDN